MSSVDASNTNADFRVVCDTRRFELNLSAEGRGFVFDHRTGDVYTLNQVGALVLRSLLDGCAPRSVAEKLAETYPISSDQALDDVRDFVADMVRMGIIDVQS